MKQSFVCIALITALLLCACTPGEGVAARPTAAQEEPSVPMRTPGETVAPEAPAAPDDSAVAQTVPAEQTISAMLPVVDSLSRALGIEGEPAYAPDDAECFWTTLYLMSVNFGYAHPLIRQESDVTIGPRKVMQEFAGAAFFDCRGLPDIPASLAQSVVYDEALDAYRLAPSDMGESTVQIDRFTLEPDGGAVVYAGLSLGDEPIGELRFVLTANPNAKDTAGTQYPYSVAAAERLQTHGTVWRKLPASGGQVDLDGDGVLETVELVAREDDSAELTVRSGGAAYTDAFEFFYNPRLFWADTRAGDGNAELYFCGDIGSDDYQTYVYRMVDGQVQRTELWGYVEYTDGQGRVRMETWIDVLGTWGAACWYALSDGFTFARASDYAIYQYPGMRGDRGLILARGGLPAVPAREGGISELPVAARLLPIETDCSSYVVCELDSGEPVRIELALMEETWEWYIDGVPESDWFAELLYAG